MKLSILSTFFIVSIFIVQLPVVFAEDLCSLLKVSEVEKTTGIRTGKNCHEEDKATSVEDA